MALKKASFDWQDRVSNPAQVGGIETSILDNGLGKGTRIAWINTGSGLRYKVVIDRALDIVDAFHNQHSLAWLSHAGVTAPRPDAESNWLIEFVSTGDRSREFNRHRPFRPRAQARGPSIRPRALGCGFPILPEWLPPVRLLKPSTHAMPASSPPT